MVDSTDEIVTEVLKDEIVTALSELQVLEKEMQEPDFKIGKPEDYPQYSRLFIGNVVQRILRGTEEILKKMDEGVGDEETAA